MQNAYFFETRQAEHLLGGTSAYRRSHALTGVHDNRYIMYCWLYGESGRLAYGYMLIRFGEPPFNFATHHYTKALKYVELGVARILEGAN